MKLLFRDLEVVWDTVVVMGMGALIVVVVVAAAFAAVHFIHFEPKKSPPTEGRGLT